VDATWEFNDELKLRFPTFNLKDKVGFEREQLLQAEEREEDNGGFNSN
jgi:hypothetical protein